MCGRHAYLHGCKLRQSGCSLRLPGLQLRNSLLVLRHGRAFALHVKSEVIGIPVMLVPQTRTLDMLQSKSAIQLYCCEQ